jgi:hypothetical protein
LRFGLTEPRRPDQKPFAQAILKRSPFTGVLFALRKRPREQQTEAALRELWAQSEPQILTWVKAQARPETRAR